jgi:hypothetical protein
MKEFGRKFERRPPAASPLKKRKFQTRFRIRGVQYAQLLRDSIVLGADAKLYRCGLQVSEPGEAVGTVTKPVAQPLPILNNSLSKQRGL